MSEEGVHPAYTSNSSYSQVCAEAASNDSSFNNFRRNPIYNQILEHVTKEFGSEYLKIISGDPDILKAINALKMNDNYGNPEKHLYSVGAVSPTTLRYIKVLVDIKKLFKTVDGFNMCEIGGGYGGQCRIINAYFKPASYCLVDIPPALALSKRFLSNYTLPPKMIYKTMDELDQRDYDLMISNYAFSELPRTIQEIYLKKIILNSRRGYITYNEVTPYSFRKNELISIISKSRITEEKPLTYDGNCVIIWGDDLLPTTIPQV